VEAAGSVIGVLTTLPNFTMKLVRPGFGPPAEPAATTQARRRHGGCGSRCLFGRARGNRRAATASARGPRPHSLS